MIFARCDITLDLVPTTVKDRDTCDAIEDGPNDETERGAAIRK